MKVILFGATGMVGQGVLRECLASPDVEGVLSVGRGETGQRHEKLREIVHRDMADFSPIEAEFAGHDACFFCLGVSSAGLSEADYTRVTYDIAAAAVRSLSKQSPGLTFVFVSGAGADSTEQGRTMWARVKGKAENMVLRAPFKASYVFRPALIRPLHGIRSKTALYNALYAVMGPVFPALKAMFPRHVTTTEMVGRAMLRVAKEGAKKRVLEQGDINDLA